MLVLTDAISAMLRGNESPHHQCGAEHLVGHNDHPHSHARLLTIAPCDEEETDIDWSFRPGWLHGKSHQ